MVISTASWREATIVPYGLQKDHTEWETGPI